MVKNISCFMRFWASIIIGNKEKLWGESITPDWRDMGKFAVLERKWKIGGYDRRRHKRNRWLEYASTILTH